MCVCVCVCVCVCGGGGCKMIVFIFLVFSRYSYLYLSQLSSMIFGLLLSTPNYKYTGGMEVILKNNETIYPPAILSGIEIENTPLPSEK